MDASAKDISLRMEGDQLLLRRAGETADTAVKVVWARPISTRGGEIAILTQEQKELYTLPGLDALDPDSRKAAEADLARRYTFPRILRVREATADFGIRYWRVETDRGERHFAMRHAFKNAIWLTPDHLVLQDTFGCRYEINPYSALDEKSRAEVEKVL